MVCDTCADKLPGDATCQMERAEKAEADLVRLRELLESVMTSITAVAAHSVQHEMAKDARWLMEQIRAELETEARPRAAD